MIITLPLNVNRGLGNVNPLFLGFTLSQAGTSLLPGLSRKIENPAFEGIGVDTIWEFRMPKPANQFDYSTIADVIIKLEYTPRNSYDFREQVIRQLTPTLSSDRAFSFKNQFADAWYELSNPDRSRTPIQYLKISSQLSRL